MNKETFTDTVVRFAQFSDKTKIIFPDVQQLTLASIFRGILFIFAGWSGPSVHAWKALTRALGGDRDLDFKVYVIDADELPTDFADHELKVLPHGNGETFWIRDGHILHSLSKYGDERDDEIRAFTKEVYAN
jgi:hypothetical protein